MERIGHSHFAESYNQADRKRSSTPEMDTSNTVTPSESKYQKIDTQPLLTSPTAPPGSPAGTDPGFDAVYIDDPAQFDSLVAGYQQTHPDYELRIIKTPQDIDTQDLVKKIVIHRGAGNQVIEEELPGLLFNDEPVVVFIDAAHMSAGQLAGLNEFIEQRPKFQGKNLSDTCRVVVLLSAKMHRIPRGQNSEKPGMDFISRVSRYTNSWSLKASQETSQEKTQEEKPLQETGELDDHTPVISGTSQPKPIEIESVPVDWSPNNVTCKVLDFQYRDWRDVLYGAYDQDADNNPKFEHSVLHELAQHSGQSPVAVLRFAPWYDPAFRLAMTELKAKGCYHINGETITTSSVDFVRQEVEPEALKQRLLRVFSPEVVITGNHFCLNQGNLEDILSDTGIKEGKVVVGNVLPSILERSPCLRVTSRLTEEQWLKLLLKLESCGLSAPVPLVIDNPRAQPIEFQLTESYQTAAASVHPYIMVLQGDEGYLLQQVSVNVAQKWGIPPQDLYSLSLTPDLDTSDITSCLQVQSFARREFEAGSTPLVEALEKGMPVVLKNLHKNPAIQQNLESLLSTPPFLLINGTRKEFHNARIVVLQPETGTFTSPVWKSLKNENIPLDEATKSQYLQEHFKLSHEEYSNLKKLLAVMGTIPASSNRLWPHPAPGMSFDVLSKLVPLAQQICKQQTGSKSGQRQTEHWRKALSVGLFEEYMCAPEVYSYLKLACDQLFPAATSQSVLMDVSAMERFLDEHSTVNKDLVKKHAWSLSRLVSPDFLPAFQLTDPYDEPPSFTVNIMYSLLEGLRNEREQSLAASMDGYSKEIEQQLSDALRASRWTMQTENAMDTDNTSSSPLSEDRLVETTRLVCASLADKKNSTAMLRISLEKILGDFPNTSYLIENLISGKKDWEAWQNSRYQQLAELLTEQRIVALKGEAGASKTYTAHHVARALNPCQPPFTVSISPQDTQASLLRQQVTIPIPVTQSVASLLNNGLSKDDIKALEAMADSTSAGASSTLTLTLTKAVKTTLKSTMSSKGYEVAVARFSDIGTEYRDGPLLRWAKTAGAQGHPVILIIDEGNLAPPALWDMLQGMQDEHPFISCGGERILLTKNHRIIFTGNPESAPGRHTSLSLRNQMTTLYYPALPDEFLKYAIASKRLSEAENLEKSQQEYCLQQIMRLWVLFRQTLPEHEFTPRDLNEICDRLLRYISMEKAAPLEETLLIQLVWLAVSETLGGECHPETTQFDTLLFNFQQQQQGLKFSDWSAVEQSFAAFFLRLQKRATEQFTVDTPSVRSLARTIWSALKGQEEEKNNNKIALGKHATLIEGPPGRGKDALLDLVLGTERPEAFITHLNAGVSDWEEVKSAIQSAADAGEIIAISELNLLPSEFLEGELNDLLTGEARPGFHLIATINSPEFSGRMPFSPALQSRFVQHKIADYGDDELYTISLNNLPEQQQKATLLTRWHCHLRIIMQGMGIGLQPCTRDLSSLLNYVGRYPGISETQMEELFYQQHRILIENARLTPDKIFHQDQAPVKEGEKGDKTIESMDIDQTSTGLSQVIGKQAFFKTFSERFPRQLIPTVSLGSSNLYDQSTKTVTLDAQAFDQEALQTVIRLIVEHKWRSSAVPDVYPMHSDTLARALLVRWKRDYARSVMPDPKDPATQAHLNLLYPFAGDERLTLEMPENAYYIDATSRLLKAKGLEPKSETFQDFLKILRTPIAHPEKPLLPAVDASDESMDTEEKSISFPPPVMIPLSSCCSEKGKRVRISQTFPGEDYTSVRESLITPAIDSNGGLVFAVNPLGQSGFSILDCVNFNPEKGMHDSQFQSRQTLRADGQWHVLSAHKCCLQAYPKSIGSTPAMTVEIIKDRASGLFLARTRNEGKVTADTVLLDIIFDSIETTGDHSTFLRDSNPPYFSPAAADLAISAVNNHYGDKINAIREALEGCTSMQEKISMITAFCTSGTNLEPLTMTQDAYEQWQALLNNQPMTPEHRCLVFWALANYCSIPCRIGQGPGKGNVWVEILQSGSVLWKVHGLGGTIENPDMILETPSEFPEKKRYNTLGLSSDIIDRAYSFSSGQPYSPEEVKILLSEIKPGAPDYYTVSLVAPRLIAINISRSGPVTPDLAKAWLKSYVEAGKTFDHREQVKDKLPQLLQTLHERAGSGTPDKSDELCSIYHELAAFILSNKWLPTGCLANDIHTLLDQPVKSRDALAAKSAFYREQLTRRLKLDRDIRRARQGDKLARNKLDPDVLEAVSQMLIGQTAPELIKQLHAEVPGVEYARTPPGRPCLVRMLRRLPAFQRSTTISTTRPALVVTPTLPYSSVFSSAVQKGIAKPDLSVNMFQNKRSGLFADYIQKYVRFAFLKYLYETSGGASGRMQSLCIHETSHRFTKPLYDPYKPETSGIFTPENVDEFYELNCSDTHNHVDVDERRLNNTWIKEGFNESSLCLLTQAVVKKCAKNYLDGADWKCLLKTVETLPHWQKHVENEKKKHTPLIEKVRHRSKEMIEKSRRKGEKPDEHYIQTSQIQEWLVDDIDR